MNTPRLQQRGGVVDSRNPVNWQHPLNQGLVSLWLPFGAWTGGGVLRDLCRKYDGTLNASLTWAGAPRGFSSIRSVGGAKTPVLGNGPGLPSGATDPWTMTFYVQTYANVNLSLYGGWGPQSSITGDVTGEFRALGPWVGDYHGWFSNVDFNTGIAVDLDGLFHHVAMTWDGSTCRFYRDGVERANATPTLSAISAGPYWYQNTSHYIGNSPNADVAGFAIYSRCLSPTQMESLYNQTSLGYPDILNWCRPWVMVGGGAAPTFQAAWASQRCGIIGGGLR